MSVCTDQLFRSATLPCRKIKDIKLVATIEQMKEDTANEQLITKFLSKVNPTGWRTNRKAALIELEKALFYNKTQVYNFECILIIFDKYLAKNLHGKLVTLFYCSGLSTRCTIN